MNLVFILFASKWVKITPTVYRLSQPWPRPTVSAVFLLLFYLVVVVVVGGGDGDGGGLAVT